MSIIDQSPGRTMQGGTMQGGTLQGVAMPSLPPEGRRNIVSGAQSGPLGSWLARSLDRDLERLHTQLGTRR